MTHDESGKAQVGYAKGHRKASKALALSPVLEPNRTPGVVRLLGLLTGGNNATSIYKTEARSPKNVWFVNAVDAVMTDDYDSDKELVT